MTGQDNETLQRRVSQAVIAAVIDAGRAYPGALDAHLNVIAVFEGLCEATAELAVTLGERAKDPETSAALIETLEAGMIARLRFFAEKIRSGEYPPPERPKPRLIE